MTHKQLIVLARITHAVTSACYVVAVWAALGAVLFLLSTRANAQGVDMPCGKGGTAKIADGTVVTRTDQEATEQNARIKADGFWWTCEAPAYVPPPVLPRDCVPPDQGFRTWSVGPYTCTTARRNASSADDPARDRVILHGRIAAWQQWTGSMRGALIERCTNGVRTVAGSSCEPVRHCDTKFSTSNDGGKTVYTYDARGVPVALGAYVFAASADGKTLKIRCVAGDFQRAR